MLLGVITVIGLLAFTLMNLVSSSGSGAAANNVFAVGVRMIQHNANSRMHADSVELSSRRLASLRSELSGSVVLVLGPDGTLNEIDLSKTTASPEKKSFKRTNHVQSSLLAYLGGGSRRSLSKDELFEGNREQIFTAPRYAQEGPGPSFIISESVSTSTVIANSLSE